jgi:hypothetical protein
MGDYIVHRARFFDYQPKAIQSMSYDEMLKKLAISRSDNTIEIWCTQNEYLESVNFILKLYFYYFDNKWAFKN